MLKASLPIRHPKGGIAWVNTRIYGRISRRSGRRLRAHPGRGKSFFLPVAAGRWRNRRMRRQLILWLWIIAVRIHTSPRKNS